MLEQATYRLFGVDLASWRQAIMRIFVASEPVVVSDLSLFEIDDELGELVARDTAVPKKVGAIELSTQRLTDPEETPLVGSTQQQKYTV